MQEFLSKVKGDQVLWAVVIILSLMSLLAVFSATGSLAWRMDKSAGYYFVKQLTYLFVGLVLVFVVHKINYTRFARISSWLFLISIPLLAYTLFFGTTLNEGARWIKIPMVNLTFQTSDFARLAIFTYLARTLSIRQNHIKDWKKGFSHVVIPVILICGLVAPANLSTAVILGITCCLLFYIGRVKISHILLLAVGIFGLLFLVYLGSKATGMGRAVTWENRISNFFNNDENKSNDDGNYQITQAKIAIASGGVLGRGPGNSWARDFLPHPYSDFIFAIIIEEYGILGAVILLSLYLTFLWRSILIFKRIPYAFGAFLAIGLSFTLVFQALVNMAVNVQLLPVTGLTLPLVSMGGSSILFTSVAIGIILSVSRYVDEMEGASLNNKSNTLATS